MARTEPETTWIVPRELSGLPLDKFLASQMPHLDRAYLRSLIREGRVSVDGVPMITSRALSGNAVVMIDAGEGEAAPWNPKEERRAPILYQDDAIAIVDKPPGLTLQSHTLARHVPELAAPRGESLHLAARIEGGMSGVTTVAKTLAAARALEHQYSQGSVELEIVGIVVGNPDQDSWEIDLPLGPDARRSGRRVVDREGGDPAVTSIEVRARYDGFAEVAAFPRTHRTHQARVHLAASGYPPAVDPVYGMREAIGLSEIKRGYTNKAGKQEKPLLERLSLHARSLALSSPARGPVRIESPWPADYLRLRSALERHRSQDSREPRGSQDDE